MANGYQALYNNTTGSDNTATGAQALLSNTQGQFNTAIGYQALSGSTGDSNVALGAGAGAAVTTASSVICIGATGENASSSCYIGQIHTTVQPVVGTDPDYVTIRGDGRLGRANVSSRRYKHDIKPMDKASEVLFSLKPVSFRYNKQYDATQTIAFGLIAEEVAEVNRDLVGRNPEGQPESVRYEQINAMLLNEFLKEHRKVEEQGRTIDEQETTIGELKSKAAEHEATIVELGSTIAQQQKEIQNLMASVREQSAQIQKVSARLATGRVRPAGGLGAGNAVSQTAFNDR
jgi:uncharacterized coiled-coil protein SlyX